LEFVNYIACNPEAGDVIPESGGVRKVRWSRSGAGKRGGARVIYFYHDDTRPLFICCWFTPRDGKRICLTMKSAPSASLRRC